MLIPRSCLSKNSSAPASLSYQEVKQIGTRLGVKIYCRRFGPFYRITLSPMSVGSRDRVYGYSSGFVLPFMEYMHCDMIEIDNAQVRRNEVLRQYRLWLGLLMGMATFTFGLENGCRRAEALAIKDNEITFGRLLKFYQRFGFQPIRAIEGGWGDLVDMLLWGGVGTKMEADIEEDVLCVFIKHYTLSEYCCLLCEGICFVKSFYQSLTKHRVSFHLALLERVSMACLDVNALQNMALTLGMNHIGAHGGCERIFPSIRLRGLPFHVTEDDIRLFLGCDTVDVLMVKKEGRFCGEAFVVLASPLFVDLALTKNKSYMGRRYIEIFRAKKLDYYRAIFSEMTDGSTPVVEARPRRIHNHGQMPNGETKSRMIRSTVLKLRGLPFKVTTKHVADWFQEGVGYQTPITSENVHIVADYGRPSGTGFVEFGNLPDAQAAFTKDRQMMGTRYIEIFESNPEERARYSSH